MRDRNGGKGKHLVIFLDGCYIEIIDEGKTQSVRLNDGLIAERNDGQWTSLTGRDSDNNGIGVIAFNEG